MLMDKAISAKYLNNYNPSFPTVIVRYKLH